MSLIKCLPETFNILAEVAGERVRQDAKWGVQNVPSIRQGGTEPEWIAKQHGIISERAAKSLCETAFAAGIGTYADIAIEEMAEAICAGDDNLRRAELVQVAAVAVAWIESIDRRKSAAVDWSAKAWKLTHPVNAFQSYTVTDRARAAIMASEGYLIAAIPDCAGSAGPAQS